MDFAPTFSPPGVVAEEDTPEVDIEADPAAAEFVMSVNGGNQTVPTVKFADGSALTNPDIREVKAKLAS